MSATVVNVPASQWEAHAKAFCQQLNEKQKRWFGATLASLFGWGGVQKAAQICELNPKTLRQGRRDLARGLEEVAPGRIRRPGAGRPPVKKRPLPPRGFEDDPRPPNRRRSPRKVQTAP